MKTITRAAWGMFTMALFEDLTRCELEDWAYFMPSFLPSDFCNTGDNNVLLVELLKMEHH